MKPNTYVLEKACFVPQGLAYFGETLRSANGRRSSEDHLCVALRASLELCVALRGSGSVDPAWVLGLLRGGGPYWKSQVKPALCPGCDLAGPEEGSPELTRVAGRSLAALLDLAEALSSVEAPRLVQNRLRIHLAWCLAGAAKVVTTLVGASWDHRWPDMLASGGRRAFAGVLATWRATARAELLTDDMFAPLDEAWLFAADPDRTATAERVAERRRRRRVDAENALPGDLIVPERFREVTVRRIERTGLAPHRACAAFAEVPEGGLVLAGGRRSGVRATAWAIARHWFAERLWSVRSLSWIDLVTDNLQAQTRSNWDADFVVLHDLVAVELEDGSPADPGYAERLLVHRLERGLPTVVVLEEVALEELHLRPETTALLEAGRRVDLPELSEPERESARIPF